MRLPLDPVALVLLIVANGTPVVLALLLGARWARPIDAGRTLRDGQPVLGSHKTWRGLAGGGLAAGAAGAVLSLGFVTGAIFGLLALAGDLLSSFVKRRMARASGRSTPLVDQLPEALLPMLVLQERLGLDLVEIVGTATVFTLLDLAAGRALRAGRGQRSKS